ncbi:hypothetical protein pb186bvf_001023 [Paramecium bursaria]
MFFNFNRIFGGGFASQLDTLLEKPDITLEQILDEDIMQELKFSGGQKFGGFVVKNPDAFQRLLHYVLQQDEELQSRAKQVRYPFMISEVFQADNNILIDYFFEADKSVTDYEEHEETRKTFLKQLFSFIDRDYLNLTAAGYFSKVVLSLIRKRGYDLWDFLDNNKQILSNLIKHLDVIHIAEIIERLIIFDQSDDASFIEQRRSLLKRVIAMMSNKPNLEVIENASYIVNEVCTKADSKFYNEIYNPQQFFTIALNSGSSTVVQLIISIVETLQKYFKQEQESKGTIQQFDYSAFFPVCAEIPRALSVDKIQISSFQTSYGASVSPFSSVKLKILQLYFTLLKIGDPKIIQNFENLEVFSCLKDFLVKYQFNNQLQNLFYDIINHIFNNDSCYQLQNILTEGGLFEFIARTNTNDKIQIGRMNKVIKPGYCGMLSKLSNQLITKAPNDSPVWDKYVKETLNKINQIEQVYMLNINPNQRPPDDDNDVNMQRLLDVIVQSIDQKIEHHRNDQKELETDDKQETVQVEEDEEHDENEPQEEEQQESNEERIKRPPQLKEEQIEQKEIEQIINSPKTSPKEISVIVEQISEKALQSKSPQEVDQRSEQALNKYWKAHEHDHEHQQDGRKKSQEEIIPPKEEPIQELIPSDEEVPEDIQEGSVDNVEKQEEVVHQEPVKEVEQEKVPIQLEQVQVQVAHCVDFQQPQQQPEQHPHHEVVPQKEGSPQKEEVQQKEEVHQKEEIPEPVPEKEAVHAEQPKADVPEVPVAQQAVDEPEKEQEAENQEL